MREGQDMHFLAILGGASLVLIFGEFMPVKGTGIWLGALVAIELLLLFQEFAYKRNLLSLSIRSWLTMNAALHCCVSMVWGCVAVFAVRYLNVWQDLLVFSFLFMVLAAPVTRLSMYFPMLAGGIIIETLMVIYSFQYVADMDWRLVVAGIMFFIGSCVLLYRGRLEARRLLQQLMTDSATGLPNRSEFEKKVRSALARKREFDILVCNIHQFQRIVSNYGIQAGDAVLSHISTAIQQLATDILFNARLTGNAFAVLVRSHDADRLARRIIDLAGKNFQWGPDHVPLDLTIGIASSSDQSRLTAEALIDRASLASSLPGKGASGRVYRYDAGIREKVDKAEKMRVELESAIARKELVLHYQPKVAIDSRTVTGAEALIRWHSNTFGMVSPEEFIPIAEETGLISSIGEWVIQQATADLQTISVPGQFAFAVNVSIEQFSQDSLLEVLEESVQELGADRSLEIEITESLIMQDPEEVRGRLKEISRLGIRIALDDFGTGYSSLRYLTELPLDKIKLDKSFIRNIPDDPIQSAIVQAVISISSLFGKEVIAEGVETERHLETLKKWKCQTAQGYYFARPMSLGGLNTWLQEF